LGFPFTPSWRSLAGGASAVRGQPGQFSPSFGVWEHAEDRTYRAVTDAFIFLTGGEKAK